MILCECLGVWRLKLCHLGLEGVTGIYIWHAGGVSWSLRSAHWFVGISIHVLASYMFIQRIWGYQKWSEWFPRMLGFLCLGMAVVMLCSGNNKDDV